jgi:hypothetical protein
MAPEFAGRNHGRLTTNDFRLPCPDIPGDVSRVDQSAFRHHRPIINTTVICNNQRTIVRFASS